MNKIKCNIETCKHNDCGKYCELSAIRVPYCEPCGKSDVHNCEDSMCASFQNK